MIFGFLYFLCCIHVVFTGRGVPGSTPSLTVSGKLLLQFSFMISNFKLEDTILPDSSGMHVPGCVSTETSEISEIHHDSLRIVPVFLSKDIDPSGIFRIVPDSYLQRNIRLCPQIQIL